MSDFGIRISDLLTGMQESGNAVVGWKVVKWDPANQREGLKVDFGFVVSGQLDDRIPGPVSPFGANPGYVPIWVLDVAGFAMKTI